MCLVFFVIGAVCAGLGLRIRPGCHADLEGFMRWASLVGIGYLLQAKLARLGWSCDFWSSCLVDSGVC